MQEYRLTHDVSTSVMGTRRAGDLFYMEGDEGADDGNLLMALKAAIQ